MGKIYDVGNLNAGMFRGNGFYHERFVFPLAMERYTTYAIAGKICKDLTEKMQEVRKTRGTK